MAQWMRRIGSREAMEKRQALRACGAINWELRHKVKFSDAARGRAHSLHCKCGRCAPGPNFLDPM